jgi:hypothetical protein
MDFFAALPQRTMKPLVALKRQWVGPALPVERDGPADVVHDHLAGVASGHVFLELLADGRVHRALHVFVQSRKQFRALHFMPFRLN